MNRLCRLFRDSAQPVPGVGGSIGPGPLSRRPVAPMSGHAPPPPRRDPGPPSRGREVRRRGRCPRDRRAVRDRDRRGGDVPPECGRHPADRRQPRDDQGDRGPVDRAPRHREDRDPGAHRRAVRCPPRAGRRRRDRPGPAGPRPAGDGAPAHPRRGRDRAAVDRHRRRPGHLRAAAAERRRAAGESGRRRRRRRPRRPDQRAVRPDAGVRRAGARRPGGGGRGVREQCGVDLPVEPGTAADRSSRVPGRRAARGHAADPQPGAADQGVRPVRPATSRPAAAPTSWRSAARTSWRTSAGR